MLNAFKQICCTCCLLSVICRNISRRNINFIIAAPLSARCTEPKGQFAKTHCYLCNAYSIKIVYQLRLSLLALSNYGCFSQWLALSELLLWGYMFGDSKLLLDLRCMISSRSFTEFKQNERPRGPFHPP